MSKLLEAKGIHKTYGTGRAAVRVLRGASLDLEAGEFVAVMGASGCGKSTLLHILGALDAPDSGKVTFRGHEVSSASPAWQGIYRNEHVGFVFQFYHLLPELSVLENVLVPRMVMHSFWNWQSQAAAAKRDAAAILERVGLKDRLRHRPRELSGGEQQRAAVARALLNRPQLLLADEPTGNLDEVTGGTVLELFRELNDAGQTIIMVTHDTKVASRAHRCVQLSEGIVRDSSNHPAGNSPRPARTEVSAT